MNVISPLPAALRPFSFIFSPASGYKIARRLATRLSSSNRRSTIPHRLITTYAMLPRDGTGVPTPPSPPPPPQEPALPQGDEEEDSDDDEFFADLPTDVELEEPVAEQRAILMSFETQHRD
jgi:hypothetical protein